VEIQQLWRGCPEGGYCDTCGLSERSVLEVVTGVEGFPVEGYCNKYWLMDLWSTKAIVEGTVLKAWY
jgi:hypothetical protein